MKCVQYMKIYFETKEIHIFNVLWNFSAIRAYVGNIRRDQFYDLVSSRCFLIIFLITLSPHALTISYHESWGEFRVKNAALCMFKYTFLASFIVFHPKITVFITSIFFWWSIKFPQQKINQSETGIGDKKLSI